MSDDFYEFMKSISIIPLLIVLHMWFPSTWIMVVIGALYVSSMALLIGVSALIVLQKVPVSAKSTLAPYQMVIGYVLSGACLAYFWYVHSFVVLTLAAVLLLLSIMHKVIVLAYQK